MIESTRTRLLRRGRHVTAGVVVAAVCGTAGLAAVAAATGAAGATGTTTSDDGGSTSTGRSTDQQSGLGSATGGDPHGGSNAS